MSGDWDCDDDYREAAERAEMAFDDLRDELDETRELLTAERAKVKALREALVKARVAVVTWSPNPVEPLDAIDAALAATSGPEPEAPPGGVRTVSLTPAERRMTLLSLGVVELAARIMGAHSGAHWALREYRRRRDAGERVAIYRGLSERCLYVGPLPQGWAYDDQEVVQ